MPIAVKTVFHIALLLQLQTISDTFVLVCSFRSDLWVKLRPITINNTKKEENRSENLGS